MLQGKSEECQIKNDIAEIRRLAYFVESFGKLNNFSGDLINDINLSLEEIVSNIIFYGYKDGKEHLIDIRIGMAGEELILEVSDDAKPFDPLEAPAPDIEKPIDEKEEGGLGIFLARSIMDKMKYRREDSKNILIMRKKII